MSWTFNNVAIQSRFIMDRFVCQRISEFEYRIEQRLNNKGQWEPDCNPLRYPLDDRIVYPLSDGVTVCSACGLPGLEIILSTGSGICCSCMIAAAEDKFKDLKRRVVIPE